MKNMFYMYANFSYQQHNIRNLFYLEEKYNIMTFLSIYVTYLLHLHRKCMKEKEFTERSNVLVHFADTIHHIVPVSTEAGVDRGRGGWGGRRFFQCRWYLWRSGGEQRGAQRCCIIRVSWGRKQSIIHFQKIPVCNVVEQCFCSAPPMCKGVWCNFDMLWCRLACKLSKKHVSLLNFKQTYCLPDVADVCSTMPTFTICRIKNRRERIITCKIKTLKRHWQQKTKKGKSGVKEATYPNERDEFLTWVLIRAVEKQQGPKKKKSSGKKMAKN